jgi:hypothetical protein
VQNSIGLWRWFNSLRYLAQEPHGFVNRFRRTDYTDATVLSAGSFGFAVRSVRC